MIITDLSEYVGKRVEVYFMDGRIQQGVLKYVPSYSEQFNFLRPKHFYLDDSEKGFRSYHVDSVKEIKQ